MESFAIPVEQVGAHAVFVDRHADHPRVRGSKSLQRGEKRGLFDQYAVAGVHECAHTQIQPLLGAGQHHHVVGVATHAALRHVVGEQFAQLGEPFDGGFLRAVEIRRFERANADAAQQIIGDIRRILRAGREIDGVGRLLCLVGGGDVMIGEAVRIIAEQNLPRRRATLPVIARAHESAAPHVRGDQAF